MTAPRHDDAKGGQRYQSRLDLGQRVLVLPAAAIVLGAIIAISFLLAPAPQSARLVPGAPDPVEQSLTTGRTPAGPAHLTAASAPAVQAPGRATTVGLTASKAAIEIDWDDGEMKTVDRDPGGSFKWDSKTGSVEVCDIEPDGHLVRGRVTLNGKTVRARDGKPLKIRAGENGKCYVKRIKNYKRTQKYQFKICLHFGDEWKEGHCNTSNSRQWPKVDIEDEGYCHHRSTTEERSKCAGVEKKKEAPVLKPPKIKRKPDKYFLTYKPDTHLSHGHPKGAAKVAEPTGIVLRWLVWFASGGCVLGFMLVGGTMAIKHKRGEFGAHGTGMSWVLIACIVVGSGVAVAFIALLVDPL